MHAHSSSTILLVASFTISSQVLCSPWGSILIVNSSFKFIVPVLDDSMLLAIKELLIAPTVAYTSTSPLLLELTNILLNILNILNNDHKKNLIGIFNNLRQMTHALHSKRNPILK